MGHAEAKVVVFKGTGLKAGTLRWCRCVVRLRHPNLDFYVMTQKSCRNRQEEWCLFAAFVFFVYYEL
jgi:hypothetical protein